MPLFKTLTTPAEMKYVKEKKKKSHVQDIYKIFDVMSLNWIRLEI